jgi:repressor LexA
MGVSVRIFLIPDDDSINRISLSRFTRLNERDQKECFPEYAGKRIRYALAGINLVDRKPVDFLYMEYGYLDFDANGQFDIAEQEKAFRLGSEMIDFKEEDLLSPKIVHAQDRFAQKRYRDKYRWTPTEELEAKIMAKAWGINLDDKKKEKDQKRKKLYLVNKRKEVKVKYTQKQGQYLAYIYYYTKIHGYAPSEADMQKYFKVSPPSVHRMILALDEKGLIKRFPGQARSISLLVSREELPDLE